MTHLRRTSDPSQVTSRHGRLGILAGFALPLATPVVARDIEPISAAVLTELDMALVEPRPMVTVPGIGSTSPSAFPIAPDLSDPAYAAPMELIGPQLDEDEVSVTSASGEPIPVPRREYASFGEDVETIKWEALAVYGYYTAINAPKLFRNPTAPKFQTEGWFGRDTNNVGIDKLSHAYSAYVISELLHARLRRKTGDAPGIEWTSAALASGAMLWSEFFDSIEPDSGWSWEDVTFNTLGAGFSVLRNAVPGLDRKLDFRLMIVPNENIYTLSGKEHFRQQRHFFALKPAGFKALERTPLRFVEFHLGYRGDDFLNEDRAAGLTPKRHIFVGLGLNLREIFFKNPRTRAGRAVGDVLDYFQPPYTAIQHDITE